MGRRQRAGARFGGPPTTATGWHPLFPTPEQYAAGRADDPRPTRGRRGAVHVLLQLRACTPLLDASRPTSQRARGPSWSDIPDDFTLRAAAARRPRWPAALRRHPRQVAADIAAYVAAGVEHFTLRFANGSPDVGVDDMVDQMQRFVAEVACPASPYPARTDPPAREDTRCSSSTRSTPRTSPTRTRTTGDARASTRSTGATIPNHRVWPHYWMLSRADGRQRRRCRDWRTFSSAARHADRHRHHAAAAQHVQHGPAAPRRAARHPRPRADAVARSPGSSRTCAATPTRSSTEFREQGASTPPTDYAQMIPTITMCALMDLPVERAREVPEVEPRHARRRRLHEPEPRCGAYGEMDEYWEGLVAERRERPGARPHLADPPHRGAGRGPHRRRGRRVLLAAARRRAEHDDEHDHPRGHDARPLPRPAAHGSRASPTLWNSARRGAAALRVAGAGPGPHDDARRRAARRHDPRGRPGAACSTARPTTTRTSIPDPERSTSTARSRSHWTLRPRHPLLPRQRGRPARGAGGLQALVDLRRRLGGRRRRSSATSSCRRVAWRGTDPGGDAWTLASSSSRPTSRRRSPIWRAVRGPRAATRCTSAATTRTSRSAGRRRSRWRRAARGVPAPIDPIVALAAAAVVTSPHPARHGHLPDRPARPDRHGEEGRVARPPVRRSRRVRRRLRLERRRGRAITASRGSNDERWCASRCWR